MTRGGALALIAVAALLAVVLLLLGTVAAGLDASIYLAIRGTGPLPPGPAVLREAVRDVTALSSNTVVSLIATVSAGALFFGGRRREALYLVATVVVGSLLVYVLKELLARPRPDLAAHAQYVVTLSFPSGHASKSVLLYGSLAVVVAEVTRSRVLRGIAAATAALLALAIGYSRIYLGVHWPSDVVAGWLLGLVCVLGMWWILRQRERRRAGATRPAGSSFERGLRSVLPVFAPGARHQRGR